jgi:hypothetical protein
MRLGGATRGATACAAVAAASIALAACGGGGGSGGSDEASNCGKTLFFRPLVPAGSGPAAFTMGIRVQSQKAVDLVDSQLGDRVKPRDVFVIDTQHPHTGPSRWLATFDEIKQRFPCNRIMALNGLAPNRNQPGYEFALIGQRSLDAVLVDWEQDSWEDSGRGKWAASPARNLVRVRRELNKLTALLKGTKTRIGLAPDYVPPWHYGRTAAVIAAANFPLDRLHRGYQVIQTQPNCGKPIGPGAPLPILTPQLIRQYRSMEGKRLPQPATAGPLLTRELLQHVGFEVALTTHPDPTSRKAEERIGPEQGAACTQQILKAGGTGILYWASPQSVKAMLDAPAGQDLRPQR